MQSVNFLLYLSFLWAILIEKIYKLIFMMKIYKYFGSVSELLHWDNSYHYRNNNKS